MPKMKKYSLHVLDRKLSLKGRTESNSISSEMVRLNYGESNFDNSDFFQTKLERVRAD